VERHTRSTDLASATAQPGDLRPSTLAGCGSLCSNGNGNVKPNTEDIRVIRAKTKESAENGGMDAIARAGTKSTTSRVSSAQKKPTRSHGWANKNRSTHSDFHTTSKLVPSLVSADGTASFAPLLLTMVIEKTLLPKVLIGPEIAPAVASFVPLTPV